MKATPAPASFTTTPAPLWIIAIALVCIAASLLVLVFRESERKALDHPMTFAERRALISPTAQPLPLDSMVGQRPPNSFRRPTAATAGPTADDSLAAAPVATPTAADLDRSGAMKVSMSVGPGSVVTVQNRGAEISGRVFLKGNPPAETTIVMDQYCGKLQTAPVTTRHYIVGKDHGLANVFVYVKRGLSGTYSPPPEPVVIEQLNCFYEPYITGAMTGQTIQIRNLDSFMHNVHLTPKVAGNLERNVAQVIKGQVNDFSFANPEVLLRVKCDVHNWMFAYIGVVNHPFYAVTDMDGRFTISGLPRGSYVVEAYHAKTQQTKPAVSKSVSVNDRETKALDFVIQIP